MTVNVNEQELSIQQYTTHKALDVELSKALSSIVVEHKRRFVQFTTLRYHELLPILIGYDFTIETGIDFLKLEVMLRNNYDVVIGMNKLNTICILGYVNARNYEGNPIMVYDHRPFNEEDVHWTVNKKIIPDELQEITLVDGCKTGNMIVVSNKVYNNQSDFVIIEHYIKEMAEIVISRYSMIMQIRLNTILQGEVGNETINQLVSDIYNGSPFTKLGSVFDLDETVKQLMSVTGVQALPELKREYQNRLSELNNTIGIQSLGVDKNSGVSDTEAKSNHAFTTSNANIYLKARQSKFDLLNRRYGLDIKAMYNDNISSELGGNKIDEDNNDIV